MGPPSIVIPADPEYKEAVAAQQTAEHFMTKSQFESWLDKTHETIRPPKSGTMSISTSAGESAPDASVPTAKQAKKGFQAPQHPVSQVLKAIPPRAPSRSSKSHILSYTAHLAILARLEEYHGAHGGAELLHRAEHADSIDSVNQEAVEADRKAAGLFKVSYNLSRKAEALPRTVERRVTLAKIVDDVLSNVDASAALNKVASQGETVASAQVQSVSFLSALTPQDTTVLHSAVPSTAAGTNAIAQTLIDLKFGNKRDRDGHQRPGTPTGSDVRPEASTSTASRRDETVFGSSAGHFPGADNAPHLDYRIVRGQEMRSRAKEIFAKSVLPEVEECWCRRHRVADCQVCSILVNTFKNEDPMLERQRRLSVIGQGLQRVQSGRKPLVDVLPSFLEFSAALLRDVRDRAAMLDLDANEVLSEFVPDEGRIDPTAAWYSLLHDLCVQAVLEGYLVDGWTGTNAVEVLFNIGCGVWEGRAWTKKPPASASSQKSFRPEQDDDDDDDESEDEDAEAQKRAEEAQELATQRLVDAAECLLCSRDSAQADFERSMRDRTQEFLNVPKNNSLVDHFKVLNKKYPLSAFEAEMADFLEAANRLLGMPTLAKYEAPSGTPTDPDPYALTRYFARGMPTEPVTPISPTSAPAPLKRRKTDD